MSDILERGKQIKKWTEKKALTRSFIIARERENKKKNTKI